jgi:hypothetical protein
MRPPELDCESELELGLSEDKTEPMDYLRSLLSNRRQRQQPAALQSSALNNIPLDILWCITDYLPPESTVAFFLSCSHLKHLLGPEQFSELASSTERTLALLNLLAIDLPNCIVCVPCRRLHKMENLQKYNSATYCPWQQNPSIQLFTPSSLCGHGPK